MKFKATLLLVATFCLASTLAYNGTTCCELAKKENAFISPAPGIPVPPYDDQQCGQSYSAGLKAAAPVYVNYTYCSSKCSGMGLSKITEPSEWAAPLVQFILPSVIFSMTIPRRKKIEYDYLFDWQRSITEKKGWHWVNNLIQLAISMVLFSIILIPVVVDTIVWISVIVVGAGNMLIEGLYEAHLDYRILKHIKSLRSSYLDDSNLEIKRELLVTVAAGNLDLDKGSPRETILNSITIPGVSEPSEGNEKSRSRLLNLLGAQSSFGSAVGSPVLFYLGAFVYTILDLRNNPSSQDAAIALGFGIEWMIIVHVAIVSGCLLASNNPSTSSGIVGSDHEILEESRRRAHISRSSSSRSNLRPEDLQEKAILRDREWFTNKILGWSDTYDTKFQPVSLWSRGTNKLLWIKKSKAYEDSGFKGLMKITFFGWIFKVLLPALLLIVLPPATGGVVAYFTPPPGLGCRSISFIVYAFCQIVITVVATVNCAVENGEKDPTKRTKAQKIFTGCGFRIISAPFWFGSLVAAVGGTTMQIMGVYRNCICYTNAIYWWNINKNNPHVDLASDTQVARNSSIYWIWMGSTATVFMAVNCYIGWWYQRLIKHRFTDAVKDMYVAPLDTVPNNGDQGPRPDRNDRPNTPSDPGRNSGEALLVEQNQQSERNEQDASPEKVEAGPSQQKRGRPIVDGLLEAVSGSIHPDALNSRYRSNSRWRSKSREPESSPFLPNIKMFGGSKEVDKIELLPRLPWETENIED